MGQRARAVAGWAVAGLLALSACAPLSGPPASNPPPAPAEPAPVSEASRALSTFYAGIEADLRSRGLLRTDNGRQDAPFDARRLTETFIRIALYDEFTDTPAGYVAQERVSRLRKWVAPVRVGLRFGASVPPDKVARERARVADYLSRLSAITGHPIRLSEGSANFFLYYVNEDERLALGPEIARVMPGFAPNEIAAFTRMPASTYCQVSVVAEAGSGVYTRAFALIRAEHPDLMSLACLHEEVAQGMGLPNDSPRARPSIFNDDQEFALLTPMDEAMLRVLYNPALRPGMTIAEAQPIVESLALALLGGES